jgi:hypothetical protein
MAQDIVQILVEKFGLKMSRNMERQINNHKEWFQQHTSVTATDQQQALILDDPAARFIAEAKTTRGRKGKRAFALRSLKRYATPPSSTGERLAHIMKHINIDLGHVMDAYHITKKIGKRDVPNYGVLALGQPYVAIETYSGGRYSYGGSEHSRLRIIIPRVISPRGTNVYGDEITIEEPGYKSFVEKEGWRCYLSKFYDVDKPKGAGGKLTYLEDPAITLVHLPTLLNASDRPFPFLINWTLDSKSIAERF